MKNYKFSLREALHSRDPNLIEMVIFKMARDTELNEQTVWALLDKNTISRNLLLNYLRNFNQASLDTFMLTYSKGDERAFFAISNKKGALLVGSGRRPRSKHRRQSTSLERKKGSL